ATEAEPGVEPDAEVSFVTRDLGNVLGGAKFAGAMAGNVVLAKVRDVANWVGNAGPQTTVTGLQPGLGLAYAPADSNPDLYAGIEARIVPENITLLPKTAAQATGGNPLGEHTFPVHKGDTLASILKEVGADEQSIKDIGRA